MARFKLPVIYDVALRDRANISSSSEVGVTNGVIKDHVTKKLSNRFGLFESTSQPVGVVYIGIGSSDKSNTYVLVGYEIASTNINVYRHTSVSSDPSFVGTLLTGVTASQADVVPILSTGGTAGDDDYFIKINNPNPNTATKAWLLRFDDTIAAITDPDYPAVFTSTHSNGVAYKDRYVSVIGVTGTGAGGREAIYTSALDNCTSWGALDYVIPETNGGKAHGLEVYKDHLVFFGTKNIQMFYNSGAPTGSPFAPRKDLVYSHGVAVSDLFGARSWWRSSAGDVLAIVGQTHENKRYVGLFDGFGIKEVSNPTIAGFLNKYTAFALCGYTYSGKTYLHLSVGATTLGASASFYYDIEEGVWFRFSSAHASLSTWYAGSVFNRQANNNTVVLTFSLASAAYGSGTGRLVRVEDEDKPHVDTSRAGALVAITVTIVTPRYRGEEGYEGRRKFLSSLDVLSNNLAVGNSDDTAVGVSPNLYLSYSDDDYQTFTGDLTLPVPLTGSLKRVIRLGQFRSRAFKLIYNSTQQLLLDGLEGEVDIGSN